MQTNTEKHYGDRNSVGSKTAPLSSAGPAQDELRRRRKKKKNKNSNSKRVLLKDFIIPKVLKNMPPLRHLQQGAEFYPTWSDVYRFILLALNLNPKHRTSWSKAASMFTEARRRRVIVFNRDTRHWHGSNFQPKSIQSYKTMQIMDEIHRAQLAR